ncbi:hypothetical protein GCM10011504_35960 [Siccirubricoccus deserti]|nr:hypothetical protein GCM10011504_35960 [Siccirubricoccus deserti]
MFEALRTGFDDARRAGLPARGSLPSCHGRGRQAASQAAAPERPEAVEVVAALGRTDGTECWPQGDVAAAISPAEAPIGARLVGACRPRNADLKRAAVWPQSRNAIR